MKSDLYFFAKKLLGGIKKNPLLSVVVPVYNVERYVSKTIKSIKNSTYKNLQVIIVNDGSTDKSLKVINNIIKNDRRFTIITKKNAGLSAARNTGIKKAIGKYVTFIDGDDYIDKNYFKKAVGTLEKTKSDFAISKYKIVTLTKAKVVPAHIKLLHAKSILQTNINKSPEAMINILAWTKIYRRKFFLKHIKEYEEDVLYEDNVPAMKGYIKAKKFDILSSVGVYWVRRDNGTSIVQDYDKGFKHRFIESVKSLNLLKENKKLYQLKLIQLLENNNLQMQTLLNYNIKNKDKYVSELKKLYDSLTDEQKRNCLSVPIKLLLYFILNKRYDDGVKYLAFHRRNQGFLKGINYKQEKESLYGYVPCYVLPKYIPKDTFFMNPKLLDSKVCISKIEILKNKIIIEGYAYLYGIKNSKFDIFVGNSKVEHKKVKSLEKKGAFFVDNSNQGFRIELDIDFLKKLNVSKSNLFKARFNINGVKVIDYFESDDVVKYYQEKIHKFEIHNEVYEINPLNVFSIKKLKRKTLKKETDANCVCFKDVKVKNNVLTVLFENKTGKALNGRFFRKNYEKNFNSIPAKGNFKLNIDLVEKKDNNFKPKCIPQGYYKFEFMDNNQKIVQTTPLQEFSNKISNSHSFYNNKGYLTSSFNSKNNIVFLIKSGNSDGSDSNYHLTKNSMNYDTSNIKFSPKNIFYMECLIGTAVNDSQLEMSKIINQKYSDKYKVVWGIKNYSVRVPKWDSAVILKSAEHYKVISEAKLLSFNREVPENFIKQKHQTVIGTYHGHPFKTMGISKWKVDNVSKNKQEFALKRRALLDYVLASSPLAKKLYLKEFNSVNKIIENGYPRNDSLFRDKKSVDELRKKFGIKENKKIVFFAPTWRNYLALNPFKVPIKHFVDPYELAEKIGDEYIILFRGHNSHAASSYKQVNSKNIIDVTYYEDVNDLMLMSDVGVFDYSSIRFDFPNTNKPMVYFVPDEKEFFEAQPPLFPYNDSIAGPKAVDMETLVDAIKFVTSNKYFEKYGKAYKKLKQTFCPWDNKHSADEFVGKILKIKND